MADHENSRKQQRCALGRVDRVQATIIIVRNGEETKCSSTRDLLLIDSGDNATPVLSTPYPSRTWK